MTVASASSTESGAASQAHEGTAGGIAARRGCAPRRQVGSALHYLASARGRTMGAARQERRRQDAVAQTVERRHLADAHALTRRGAYLPGRPGSAGLARCKA